ncbi:10301_t:CDS:2 [Gigaspora margarita]|uniref:10301_t:CDS:1 n=1 Tax=Gigaspora margarita TaxID=4874 RepID=A0ABN7UMM6_GIGMA|nr:10301_t:CDS:2 [Gigaspora margarita]
MLGKYFAFYGITYHPTRKEYMLVIDYADRGDLRSCLINSRLYWSEKLQILTDYEEEEADDDTLQIHPEAIYICRVMNLGNLNEIGVEDENAEDENADYEE